MSERNALALANDFLSAAHVFSRAMQESVEEELLRDALDGQLTPSQIKLLKLVGLNDFMTIGDAALFLNVSHAAASKAVDKLVRARLLQRRRVEKDRRKICLSLTDISRKLLSRYEKAREEKLKDIFRMSAPAELRRVAAWLDCLSARIAIDSSGAQPGKPCSQCGTYFRPSCILRTQLGRECLYLKGEAGMHL
jgi:DNA-binding MarR family transcriptional regulator